MINTLIRGTTTTLSVKSPYVEFLGGRGPLELRSRRQKVDRRDRLSPAIKVFGLCGNRLLKMYRNNAVRSFGWFTEYLGLCHVQEYPRRTYLPRKKMIRSSLKGVLSPRRVH